MVPEAVPNGRCCAGSGGLSLVHAESGLLEVAAAECHHSDRGPREADCDHDEGSTHVHPDRGDGSVLVVIRRFRPTRQ